MSISAEQVKALRESTGAGMMDCKKALQETGGDFEEAKLWLQKKGMADSKKRAGRSASQGTMVAAHAPDNRAAVLFELNCETDFVARNEEFVDLANQLARLALQHKVPSAGALLELQWNDKSVNESVLERSGKTGEKIVARRLGWVTVPDGTPGTVGSYIHDGGRVGVILAVSGGNEAQLADERVARLVKDLTLHIAASDPLVVSTEQINAADVARQTEIFTAQAEESGKPKEIAEKMTLGRLAKWKKEVSLLDQPFVKDAELTVDKHIAKVAKEVGLSAPLKVVGFVRYRLGEGVEG